MLAKLLLTTPAPTLEIIPWVLVSGLLYWLFHAFALGKASRDFYKSQESVWLLDALKSIRSSKIFSQKNKPH